MGMIDQLAGGPVVIQQDVETGTMKLGLDGRANLLQGLSQAAEEVRWNFREAGIMSLGNDQGVPLANGIDVQESQDVIGFENSCRRYFTTDNLAEDAVFHTPLLQRPFEFEQICSLQYR